MQPGNVSEMNYTYFAACSDEAAAAVLGQPVVSPIPSADHDLEGLLSDVVPGVQFLQEFGRLAELLTGEEVDFEDEELIVAETDDEMGIVSRVPADLARVIADADPSRIYELVRSGASSRTSPTRIRSGCAPSWT